MVLVADGAPVEDALVRRVQLVEHPIEVDRLPGAGVEHPGDVVGAAVGVADDAAAPGLARHPLLRAAAGEEQLGAELDRLF
jgi:hypothetical protein